MSHVKLKKLEVVVTIYHGWTRRETVLNQRTYNFLNPQDRTKIARTAWWAMHHGHEMVTRPVEDGEEVEVIWVDPDEVDLDAEGPEGDEEDDEEDVTNDPRFDID